MSPFEKFSRRIIPTRTFESLSEFTPQSGSIYLHGSTDESRASLISSHIQSAGVNTGLLENGESNTFTLTIADAVYSIGLNHGRRQDDMFLMLEAETVYLDITGLPHHIWAPLILSAQRVEQRLEVLYVEPEEYVRSRDSAQLYDLSQEYEGIKWLPGFAMLQPTGDDVCYIPLLGFEGARYSLVTTEVDPPLNKTCPIIGLPGFRPEYPFEAYFANRLSLQGDNGMILPNIRYADASCPFSLYYTLEDISSNYTDDVLKIALLGTKPHALGAAIFAMRQGPNRVQIIYDYPKRKPGRTSGIGRIYLYPVSFFLSLLTASTLQ